jgi:hypothetical protein
VSNAKRRRAEDVPKLREVDRRIDLSNLDLDRAAELVASRRPEWVELGLTVHPITWMDNDAQWNRPVLTERSGISRPMSLGLRIEGGAPAEAEIILYAGGWADVNLVAASSAEVESEYIELETPEEFGPLLDRVVLRLLGDAGP